MTSKAMDDVIRAARALVLDYMRDHNGRASRDPSVERLAAALASHDRTAHEAARLANALARMTSKPREAFEPPPSREGSLEFLPTREQALDDPLLAACHAAGMTETQVIELQRIQRRELMQQLMRRAMFEAPPIRVEADVHRPWGADSERRRIAAELLRRGNEEGSVALLSAARDLEKGRL